MPDIIEYIYTNEISYISNNIPCNFSYILSSFQNLIFLFRYHLLSFILCF